MTPHAAAVTVAVLAAVVIAALAVLAAMALAAGSWRGRGQHKADVRPIRIIPVSRRVPTPAAGRAPIPSGAPEAPALIRPHGSPGAGASPWLRAAAPEGGPPQIRDGAVPRQPWVTVQDPPGTPRGQRPLTAPLRLAVLPGGVWDGSRVRELAPPTVPADGPEARGRQTGAQPALVRPGRARYEAWQDEAVNL